jgi:TonB family protein
MKCFLVTFVLSLFATCISASAETQPDRTSDQGQAVSPTQISPPRAIGNPHICNEYYPGPEPATGLLGSTILRFHITSQGTVADIGIDKSSGNGTLDSAAVSCVSSWRYEPASQNGKPVEVAWAAGVQWQRGQGPRPFTERYPELRAQCLRAFPATADQVVTGSGITELFIQISGGVVHGKVVRSSGNAVLDQHAVACVKTWDVSNMAGTLPPFEIQWKDAAPVGK